MSTPEPVQAVEQKLLDRITAKRNAIYGLASECDKHESALSKRLLKILEWKTESRSFKGLFGFKEHKADGCLIRSGGTIVIEVKKAKQKDEWAYWHAVIQSLIYAFRQRTSEGDSSFLVLCILLDWGRKAGQKLDKNEKGFLQQFADQDIRFVRFSMKDKKFVEHNLMGDWETLDA